MYINEHSTVLSTKLCGVFPQSAICILDGTYLYCQKSANFEIQKLTYSGQKHRNLIKPMLVLAPDGYILEAEGMYMGTNNDASIAANFLLNPYGFLSFFTPEDVIILDRGFRDCCALVENLGLKVAQPSFLDGASQFSTVEANASRLITEVRWPIESINGRIKSKFKLFRNVISNHHLIDGKIESYFRIACAILNAFFVPTRTASPLDEQVANHILAMFQRTNWLKDEIEKMGLQYWTSQSLIKWQRISTISLHDFPVLCPEDIRQLTIGTYQLKLCPSYIAYRMGERDDSLKVWFNRDFSDLLRVRMDSRHRSGKSYQMWISFQPGSAGVQSIHGWLCMCPVGSRVVGTCCHIASVLWFLGYARHLDHISWPAEQVGNCLLDANTFDYLD